jgi:urease accessory protein
VKAHASVVAERDAFDGIRCTTLRSDPPLTLRRTADGLHIVGSAAGPVGGDQIDLDVELAAGASLSVRSVAAQLVFPGPRRQPSRATTRVALGADAVLRWLPEPVVAVRGADHRAVTRITMADRASVLWRDIAVLGRHDEESGSLRQRLRVESCGRPLLCTEVALGPTWPHAAGPVGVGARRVVATVLLVGDFNMGRSLPAVDGVRVGACALAGDALLVTALSDSVEALTPLLVALGAT